MAKRLLQTCSIVLAWALSICAQQNVDKQRVSYPTEEELVTNKRLDELLRHPTFITLRLLSLPRDFPKKPPTDTPPPYKVKETITFELFVTQNSVEKIVIWNYMSPYYEYRPELLKDGETISFKKSAQERVEKAEREAPEGSMRMVTLDPREERVWTRVNLEDWYEPLESGHYQLTVRKRFTPDGDWVESNPIIFDVRA